MVVVLAVVVIASYQQCKGPRFDTVPNYHVINHCRNVQLGPKLLHKCNRHRMGPAPLTCRFTSKERISKFVGIRTACVRPELDAWSQSNGLRQREVSLDDTNQSFELACRRTYALVAPSPSVCLKSSFPSLTIFFSLVREALDWGGCQTQPASPYNLPCYSANNILFCICARLWFLIQRHVPQLPRIDCTDHDECFGREWSRARAEWEKHQNFYLE